MKSNFMRVHPLWWILFIVCCVAVLTFAISMPEYVPAQMQAHLMQPVSSDGLTQVMLKLNDPQGLPINGAQIKTHVGMPAMPMLPPPAHIVSKGQGFYLLQFHLTMAGQWLIAVSAQVAGFNVPSKTLMVEVSLRQPLLWNSAWHPQGVSLHVLHAAYGGFRTAGAYYM